MRLSGLNIEIIRGETAAVAFTLTDPDGQPFRLTTFRYVFGITRSV